MALLWLTFMLSKYFSAILIMLIECSNCIDVTLNIMYILWDMYHMLALWQVVVPLWWSILYVVKKKKWVDTQTLSQKKKKCELVSFWVSFCDQPITCLAEPFDFDGLRDSFILPITWRTWPTTLQIFMLLSSEHTCLERHMLPFAKSNSCSNKEHILYTFLPS